MLSPIKLSNGASKYGAQRGRINKPVSGKCQLQKVRMIDGGYYDYAGAYWGKAETLYACQDQEQNQFFTRAWTRQQAKANILEHNKNVTFYQ